MATCCSGDLFSVCFVPSLFIAGAGLDFLMRIIPSSNLATPLRLWDLHTLTWEKNIYLHSTLEQAQGSSRECRQHTKGREGDRGKGNREGIIIELLEVSNLIF